MSGQIAATIAAMADIPSELFRFSLKDLCRLCGVHERTVQRWLAGDTLPPPAAIILLRALESRDLGFFHPAWADWVISRRGELCSPENWIATPGDVRAMQLKEAQVSALRREAFELRARIQDLEAGSGLEDQPLPTEWEFKTG